MAKNGKTGAGSISKLFRGDTWIPTKRRTVSTEEIPESFAKYELDASFTSKTASLFTCPSLTSINSVPLGCASSIPYATVSRRKGSRQNGSICDYDYFGALFKDNDSVSSLPLPFRSRTIDSSYGERRMSASVPKFASRPPSVVGDNFPEMIEEDVFSFLDEYDDDISLTSHHGYHRDYFLPTVKLDRALKVWTILDSSGDFQQTDFRVLNNDECCKKPLCLSVENEKLRCGGALNNTRSEISMWF